jgi:hypothetical protein
MRRRVLLDEHLPVTMRLWLPEVDAFTVAYRGWKGLADRELLRVAHGEIDVLVTFDAALAQDRGIWMAACGLVLLKGRNVIPNLRLATPGIQVACLEVKNGELRTVDVPS